MKVHGHDITDLQIAACVDVIARRKFTTQEVMEAARSAGVESRSGSGSRAGRVADRLLQKFRKAGEIKYSNGVWEHIPNI